MSCLWLCVAETSISSIESQIYWIATIVRVLFCDKITFESRLPQRQFGRNVFASCCLLMYEAMKRTKRKIHPWEGEGSDRDTHNKIGAELFVRNNRFNRFESKQGKGLRRWMKVGLVLWRALSNLSEIFIETNDGIALQIEIFMKISFAKIFSWLRENLQDFVYKFMQTRRKALRVDGSEAISAAMLWRSICMNIMKHFEDKHAKVLTEHLLASPPHRCLLAQTKVYENSWITQLILNFFRFLSLQLSNNEIPTSKIRKRFVTNEEALVQQLNGLKRVSK